jgi:hypothetical protein
MKRWCAEKSIVALLMVTIGLSGCAKKDRPEQAIPPPDEPHIERAPTPEMAPDAPLPPRTIPLEPGVADPRPLPASPAAAAALAGSFRVVRLDGQPLPATMHRAARCEVQLVAGTLVLADNEFRFESRTRELCDGTPGQQQNLQATGLLVREGERLRMETRQGNAFAHAEARISGNQIIIDRVLGEPGEYRVEWILQPM